jgi:hypothetical protein
MERKNTLLAGLSAAAILGALGLVWYLSREGMNSDEETLKTPSKEEILSRLEEETKTIVKPQKECNAGKGVSTNGTSVYVFNAEFTLKVYSLLSKYATMMKTSISKI